MINIGILISSVRSKLGDTSSESYRYSDNEVLNSLNTALIEISQSALPFYRTYKIQTIENEKQYPLPKDFISFAENKNVCNANDKIDYSETQTFYLKEEPSQLSNGSFPIYTLYYNYTEYIGESMMDLAILDGFRLPMVHFALSELFQSPNRENGLNFSDWHLQKYKETLILPLHHVRKSVNKSVVKSKYRVV